VRRGSGAAAWLCSILFAGCGGSKEEGGAESASAGAAAAAAPSARAQQSASPAPRPMTSVAADLGDGCSFDWIDLREAFRTCPVLFDLEQSSYSRRVRVRPSPLRVPSGGELRFSVGIGQHGSGRWTADLDDRCGLAMTPILFDARGKMIDDASWLPPPACPAARARVTLSGRGEVTASITIKAVRRWWERAPARPGAGGAASEMRMRETPLPPGPYRIEIPLPTSDGASELVDLEVTPADGQPARAP
jgi:hypothetical protein